VAAGRNLLNAFIGVRWGERSCPWSARNNQQLRGGHSTTELIAAPMFYITYSEQKYLYWTMYSSTIWFQIFYWVTMWVFGCFSLFLLLFSYFLIFNFLVQYNNAVLFFGFLYYVSVIVHFTVLQTLLERKCNSVFLNVRLHNLVFVCIDFKRPLIIQVFSVLHFFIFFKTSTDQQRVDI